MNTARKSSLLSCILFLAGNTTTTGRVSGIVPTSVIEDQEFIARDTFVVPTASVPVWVGISRLEFFALAATFEAIGRGCWRRSQLREWLNRHCNLSEFVSTLGYSNSWIVAKPTLRHEVFGSIVKYSGSTNRKVFILNVRKEMISLFYLQCSFTLTTTTQNIGTSPDGPDGYTY